MKLQRPACFGACILWVKLSAVASTVCGEGAGDRVVSVADLHGDWEHSLHLFRSLGLVDKAGNWSGGNTTFVQTGDVVDRGDDGKRLYELLFRLQDQAPSHGGKVVLNIGNHELICMQGDLRYVSAADLASYGGAQGHLASWAPDGAIGSELRKRFQPIAMVSDAVYVHAGLLPRLLSCENGFESLNNGLRIELSKSALAASTSQLLLGDGPMWTRYLALEDEALACPLLEQTLSLLGARRMIVGHTIQASGDITPRCGGRLIMSDTMMSQAYTKDADKSAHNEAALEFYGNSEIVRAIYPQRKSPCIALPTVAMGAAVCNKGTMEMSTVPGAPTYNSAGTTKVPTYDSADSAGTTRASASTAVWQCMQVCVLLALTVIHHIK